MRKLARARQSRRQGQSLGLCSRRLQAAKAGPSQCSAFNHATPLGGAGCIGVVLCSSLSLRRLYCAALPSRPPPQPIGTSSCRPAGFLRVLLCAGHSGCCRRNGLQSCLCCRLPAGAAQKHKHFVPAWGLAVTSCRQLLQRPSHRRLCCRGCRAGCLLQCSGLLLLFRLQRSHQLGSCRTVRHGTAALQVHAGIAALRAALVGGLVGPHSLQHLASGGELCGSGKVGALRRRRGLGRSRSSCRCCWRSSCRCCWHDHRQPQLYRCLKVCTAEVGGRQNATLLKPLQ